MKVQKIDDVNFSVNLVYDEKTKLDLIWKQGEMYLSVAGLCLNQSDLWYELPLTEIKSLDIVEGEKPHLKIEIGSLTVVVSGPNIYSLRGLRHLLMPYIDPNNT
jgi:hypothetical protein